MGCWSKHEFSQNSLSFLKFLNHLWAFMGSIFLGHVEAWPWFGIASKLMVWCQDCSCISDLPNVYIMDCLQGVSRGNNDITLSQWAVKYHIYQKYSFHQVKHWAIITKTRVMEDGTTRVVTMWFHLVSDGFWMITWLVVLTIFYLPSFSGTQMFFEWL